MAARPIASGTVSFGLVSIPVKLYPATSPAAGVSFNLLHKKCSSRLKQQYICPKDNEKVEREDMVKGYEFAKDRYVTFTPEELKAFEEAATQTIDIVEFVPLAKVDPVFFDRPYYLGTDRGGEKAYRLLAEAMQRTGRCALARYAARGKGYLVLIRPTNGKLIMQQLLYVDEVRDFADVPIEQAEPREAEVKLAVQLVEQISHESFRPEEYKDEVRGRVLEAIERKVAGEEVSLAPVEAPRAQIIDLMEALKASLAKGPAPEEQPGASEERKAPKRAPRSAEEPRAKTSKK